MSRAVVSLAVCVMLAAGSAGSPIREEPLR
jgi:hypothetical protein